MSPELSKTAATPSSSTPRPGGDFYLDIERRGIGDAFTGYYNRLRSGDPGALPSVLGILVLGVIFSQVSNRFLSRNNIGNLPGQGAYIALIAMGLVFVLLLGEIDLSAGTTGGVCAGFAAQAIFSRGLHHGVPTLLYWSVIGAMIAMILLGAYLRSISGPIVVGDRRHHCPYRSGQARPARAGCLPLPSALPSGSSSAGWWPRSASPASS